jgi:hypothetical protein
MFSCGEPEEQKSPEELEIEKKSKENNAQFHYRTGLAKFGLYVSMMEIHVREMEYVTEETGTLKSAMDAKKKAEDSFKESIDLLPEYASADSSRLYLDSISYYKDYFQVELDKIYNNN